MRGNREDARLHWSRERRTLVSQVSILIFSQPTWVYDSSINWGGQFCPWKRFQKLRYIRIYHFANPTINQSQRRSQNTHIQHKKFFLNMNNINITKNLQHLNIYFLLIYFYRYNNKGFTNWCPSRIWVEKPLHLSSELLTCCSQWKKLYPGWGWFLYLFFITEMQS